MGLRGEGLGLGVAGRVVGAWVSSREKTCHVSPIAMDSVCRACTWCGLGLGLGLGLRLGVEFRVSVCGACTMLSPRSSGPEL